MTQFTTGSQIGGCGNLDAKCICSNASFLSNIACCLASVCSAADQQAAVVYAKQLCTTQGVTVPDQVVCNSASGASSATSSATSAGSSAGSASGAVVASTTSTPVSTSTGSSATATLTKNAAIQKGVGGMSFVGGLAAAIALL